MIAAVEERGQSARRRTILNDRTPEARESKLRYTEEEDDAAEAAAGAEMPAYRQLPTGCEHAVTVTCDQPDVVQGKKPNAGENGRGGQRPWLTLPVPLARAAEKKCHPEHERV